MRSYNIAMSTYKKTSQPKVSVIVNTYNEEKAIVKCLSSIRDQSYENIELIVVDSKRTTDKTEDLAKRFTRSIYTYGLERSPQKNYGAKKATGTYLLFIDADMELTKDVVKECVDVALNGATAVIIPEKSFGESYWAKCKALERNCYIGDESIEAARFFLSNAFLKVGGYNEGMVSGEDWDLSGKIRKMGGKIGRTKALILHNEGTLSLLKDLKKKFYYSQKADMYISENVSGIKNIFLFLFRPAYFRNWKLLLSDPIHFPGFVVMKLSEFTVGGFGAILLKKNFWKKLLSRS
jgi:glycosyltransferase involved in cell wall biosynthesis